MVNLLNASSTQLVFFLCELLVFNHLVKGSDHLPKPGNNSSNEICKTDTYVYKKTSFL